jgi:hypothetical protein
MRAFKGCGCVQCLTGRTTARRLRQHLKSSACYQGPRSAVPKAAALSQKTWLTMGLTTVCSGVPGARRNGLSISAHHFHELQYPPPGRPW